MYLLSLDITINSVSCPGVWLCPKGTIMLKVCALGGSRKTSRICPKFPLLFCEQLAFQKIQTGDNKRILDVLNDEMIQIELIQWVNVHSSIGIVLAKFHQSLQTILDLCLINEKLNASVAVELLMRRTDYFPGIISPKISALFRVATEELSTYELQNPPLKKKIPVLCSRDDDLSDNIIHQRPVCHLRSRPNVKCHACSEYSECCRHPKK